MATIHGTNFNDNDTLQFPLGFLKRVQNAESLTSSDTLFGYAGDDVIIGDGGNDVMYGDRSSSTFDSIGFQGSDQMYGGTGNDQLYGDGGNDFLYGQADNDHLEGGDGNDQLYGGTNSAGGIDLLLGGQAMTASTEMIRKRAVASTIYSVAQETTSSLVGRAMISCWVSLFLDR